MLHNDNNGSKSQFYQNGAPESGMFLFTTVTLRTVKEPGDDIFQLTDILCVLKNRFSRIHCNCWGEGGGGREITLL